jgi:hypothetical protein
MSDNNYHINYSASDIERYWKGQLSAADMHRMEKAAMDDPFLADALEGYKSRETVPGSGVEADMADLRSRLQERVNAAKRKRPAVIAYWWKVAAAVIVIAGGTWLYTSNRSNEQDQNTLGFQGDVAKNNTAPAAENKAPAEKEQPAPSAVAKTDSSFVSNHDGTAMSFDSSSPVVATLSQDKILQQKDEYKSQPLTVKPAPLQLETKNDSNALAFQRSNYTTTSALQRPGNLREKLSKSVEPNLPVKQKEQDAEKLADDFMARKEMKAVDLGKKEEKLQRADTVSANAGVAAFGKLNLMNTFNGAVYNNLNQPMSNATVKVNGLSTGTVTDQLGNFSFKTMDSSLDVSVSSIGYSTQNFTLRNNTVHHNRVVLQPDTRSLSETIVVGYGTRKKARQTTKDLTVNVLDAEPSVGWDEYNEYLQKNKRVPDNFTDVRGDVVITFDIDSKGLMKNYKVEKSLNDTFDTEAIRLIKYGPGWKLLKGKKARASVIVTF